MMTPNYLHIAQLIHKPFALSEDDAQTLLPYIQEAMQKQEEIVISFDGLEGVSTLFLRTLLGEFYLNYGPAVDQFVHFHNLSKDDVIKTQLERLRRRALKPDEYKPIFDNAVGGA